MEIRKYCEILEVEEQMKWFKPISNEEFAEMIAEEKVNRTEEELEPV